MSIVPTPAAEKSKTLSEVSDDFQKLKGLSEDIGKSAQKLDDSIETPEQKKRRMAHIEKSLMRLSRKIDNRYLRTEIEEEIRLAAVKGDFKKVGERMKGMSEIKEDEATQAKIDELIAQQDKYGALASKIRGLKDMKSKMPKWMVASIAAGGGALSMEQIVEKYYVRDEPGGPLRAKTQSEMAWEAYDEADGFFGKGAAFVKAFIAGGMVRRQTKAAEFAVNTGMDAKETVEDLKADYGGYVESAVETGKYTAEKVGEANEARKEIYADMRENPQALAAMQVAREKAMVKAREFVGSKNQTIGKALDGVAKTVVNNKASDKMVSEAVTKVSRDIGMLPPAQKQAVASLIEKGKLTGFEAKVSTTAKAAPAKGPKGMAGKGYGKMVVISMVSRSLYDALQKKDPHAFLDNIANSNIWLESLIPGVGSYKSISRLFKDNGDSMGMKFTDLSINLLADAWSLSAIAAGCILGFGLGCVAGTAASQAGRSAIAGTAKFLTRAGMKGAARSMAKTGGKYMAKSATKGAVGTTAKLGVGAGARAAATEVAQQGTQAVAKEVGEEVAEQATKQGAEVVAEQVAKSGLKKGATWIGDTFLTSAKFTGKMAILQAAFEQLFPTEKVKEMAVDVAMDQVNAQVDPYITPGMRDLYTAISGDELAIGTPNSEIAAKAA
ncbi:MAG TPA: hypothetical protein VIT68_02330 [Candidatus Gracilibacteria bacterium]